MHAKSCFQRRLGRGSGRHRVGNESAEAKGGDGAGAIVEGYLRKAKGVASNIVHPSIENQRSETTFFRV